MLEFVKALAESLAHGDDVAAGYGGDAEPDGTFSVVANQMVLGIDVTTTNLGHVSETDLLIVAAAD